MSLIGDGSMCILTSMTDLWWQMLVEWFRSGSEKKNIQNMSQEFLHVRTLGQSIKKYKCLKAGMVHLNDLNKDNIKPLCNIVSVCRWPQRFVSL